MLAATLSAVGHVPVAGLALILGIDRFMSEARALTNFIGNGVATLVVARWTNDLDEARMRRVAGQRDPGGGRRARKGVRPDGRNHACHGDATPRGPRLSARERLYLAARIPERIEGCATLVPEMPRAGVFR